MLDPGVGANCFLVSDGSWFFIIIKLLLIEREEEDFKINSNEFNLLFVADGILSVHETTQLLMLINVEININNTNDIDAYDL